MARFILALLASTPLSLASAVATLGAGQCADGKDTVSLLQHSLQMEQVEAPVRAHAANHAQCYDGRAGQLAPDTLHVAFVCDLGQLRGVEASITSLIMNSKAPTKLYVHVMVQRQWEKQFKDILGIAHHCEGALTPKGAFIRVNGFDPAMVKKAVPELSARTAARSQGLDAVENYARFYMHTMMPPVVVVYLDADTIVQQDLTPLKKQMLREQKTAGFVERREPRPMGKNLYKPRAKLDCDTDLGLDYNVLVEKPSFNVGVFAVNLKRWARRNMTARVEQLVAMQSACDGMLWEGGSQPPLLLSFLAHPEDQPDDYTTFDMSYNYGSLGGRDTLDREDLKTRAVLHWNGPSKAWLQDGFYQDLWTPYADAAARVLRGA